MCSNRVLRWIVLTVIGLGLAAGLVLFCLWQRDREAWWELSCVGKINNLGMMLRYDYLEKGGAPISSEATRRGQELNAVLALGKSTQLAQWNWRCYTYVHKYGESAAIESYRMPDWTYDQWQKVEAFFVEFPKNKDSIPLSYIAPAIWDARPVHRGCRNVLFVDGDIRRRIPEDVFQKLRNASEEYVRGKPRDAAPHHQ